MSGASREAFGQEPVASPPNRPRLEWIQGSFAGLAAAAVAVYVISFTAITSLPVEQARLVAAVCYAALLADVLVGLWVLKASVRAYGVAIPAFALVILPALLALPVTLASRQDDGLRPVAGVAERPPEATAAPGEQPEEADDPVSAAAGPVEVRFEDVQVRDVGREVAVSGSVAVTGSVAGPVVATIDWGDGSPPAMLDDPVGGFAAAHDYSTAADGAEVSDSFAITLEVRAPRGEFPPHEHSLRVTAIDGAVYERAASASAAQFPSGVGRVNIASALSCIDAIIHLQQRRDEPLLLVGRNSVPPSTQQELRRLNPGEISVIGGSAAVADAAVEQLRGYAAGDDGVQRSSDDDPTGSSISMAAQHGEAGTVYVATAENFPDALAAAVAAHSGSHPLLLLAADGEGGIAGEAQIRAALDELGTEAVKIVGGAQAVPVAVEQWLAELLGAENVTRLSPAEARWDTAAAISADAFQDGASTVFIGGQSECVHLLVDLHGSDPREGPVLFVAPAVIPSVTRDEIARLQQLGPVTVDLLGRSDAVDDAVCEELEQLVEGFACPSS